MKLLTCIVSIIFLNGPVIAQLAIAGRIVNEKNEPLAGASVKIKNSPVGTTADSSGHFALNVAQPPKLKLQVSSVGYAGKEVPVNTGSSAPLTIILKEDTRMLGEIVVVEAGNFEASDKAKGASLTPMDAMTVAGNNGDIANSLRALPGPQQIAEREGLFVRGGTGAETKQFVDGVLLTNPNFSSVPGMPQPARLNPFLFNGILFSSGGYSALYGQAMSSALVLETVDLPDESSASLFVFPMAQGAGLQNITPEGNASYGANLRYGNHQLYNKMIDVKPDFFHGPEYLTTDANFRIKTGKHGILKFYTNYGYDHTGVRNPDPDSTNMISSYEMRGRNFYSNLSYRGDLSDNWKINTALAYNYNREQVQRRLLDGEKKVALPEAPLQWKHADINNQSDFAQARVVVTRTFRHKQALRFGAEYFYNVDKYAHLDTINNLKDGLTAAFAETDIYVARNLAAKVGLRAEYSSLLQRSAIAPRMSVAYRFRDGGQINMAYGQFYQKPESQFLLYNNKLNFSRADHYIVNYQKKARNRLLRVEAYYKQYKNLVTTNATTETNGDGYAKGFELFFRDKRTFKNFDYWITYTYLDTKRRFLNYPLSLQPDFATPHTGSIAIKRFFQDINLNANLFYSLATGRPYYNFQRDASGATYVSDKGTTNAYSNLNLSFAYLFPMFKNWKHKDFSGIGFGMNNVFGRQQVFGYNYSYNGLNKIPVLLPAARTFYFGTFMSFGIDRRDDFINDNL